MAATAIYSLVMVLWKEIAFPLNAPISPRVCLASRELILYIKKVKFSNTRYRALGPELIPVYRQSARR